MSISAVGFFTFDRHLLANVRSVALVFGRVPLFNSFCIRSLPEHYARTQSYSFNSTWLRNKFHRTKTSIVGAELQFYRMNELYSCGENRVGLKASIVHRLNGERQQKLPYYAIRIVSKIIIECAWFFNKKKLISYEIFVTISAQSNFIGSFRIARRHPHPHDATSLL